MTATVHVRPRRSLLTTAVVSAVLVNVVLFGVLYWFASQHGTWRIVLGVHIVVVLASLGVLFRQLSVFSAVTPTELIGRGIFSPLERVPRRDIATVDLVPTYVGQTPEPVVQLLVRAADGKRLFRMRGNFWHPGDLNAIADALGVPVTVLSEAISVREFFRLYPGSAYWFENKPILRVALIVGFVIVALAIAVLVMSIFGMKIGIFSH